MIWVEFLESSPPDLETVVGTAQTLLNLPTHEVTEDQDRFPEHVGCSPMLAASILEAPAPLYLLLQNRNERCIN